MSEERKLTRVYAARGEDVEGGGFARLNIVHLRALPAWLKGDRYVTADLTPKQARNLAIELLTAAQRIEDSPASEAPHV